MRNIRSRVPCIASLILALLPGLLRAQEPRLLTLREAVDLAMKKDAGLETARLEVERADARVMEAWGTALPSVDLSAQYVRTLKSPIFFAIFNGQEVSIEMGIPHALNMSLAGTQLLFNGAVIAGLGAAHIYRELSRELYLGKQLETVTTVRKQYYGALVAREAAAMMRASLQNAEENLKNVKVMRSGGVVSEYDELRATVQVDNLRPSVIQAENGYQLSLDALRTTIGADTSEVFELADSLKFVPAEDSLIDRAEQLVMERNPGLHAVDRQIDLNGAAVLAERAGYMPTVALFGQYQYQAAKDRFRYLTNNLISSAQVGISVSMNIFQGGQTYARVEQAQVEERKAEQQKLNVERSLRTGVHSVLGNLRQARKRVEAQQKTVETAERGYKIVTARYKASAATQLEVNDAQVALDQARVNRIQAIYDYLVASAELDQLIGRLPENVHASEE